MLKIDPITNALAVYQDPDAKGQLCQDAKWAHIVTTMSRKVFEEKYGEGLINDFDTPEGAEKDDWFSDDGTAGAAAFGNGSCDGTGP